MKMLRGFAEAWCNLLADRPIMVVLLGATLLYSFYYPVAYRPQVVSDLPVAVVDLDHSYLSRELARRLDAVHGVELVAMPADIAEAQTLLESLKIDGIVLIPYGFQRDAFRGKPAELALYSNGAYMIRSPTILLGFADTIQSVATEVVGRRLAAAGIAAEGLLLRSQPLSIVERPLYNTREGYGSYVVPAVAQLIVHQTLLFGATMLLARYRREQGGFASFSCLSGWILLFIVVGCLNGLYFNGLNFWLQDYPRGGNITGLLVAMPVFISAVTALALLLGSFFTNPNRAMATLSVTSLPFFFLCGLSWPLEMMPSAMLALGKLVPSTSGIQMMIKINGMGASLAEVMPELINLLLLALLYGAIGAYRLTRGACSSTEKADARPFLIHRSAAE